MTAALNYQLLRLSSLLQLEHRARGAGPRELEFIMVNETSTIVPYQQAALWERTDQDGLISAISGAALPESQAPYVIWLRGVCAAIARGPRAVEQRAVNAADLHPRLGAEWPEWFPTHGLWCPLFAPDGTMIAGLLFGRAEPWQDGDRQVIGAIVEAYGQSLIIARLPRRLKARRWHRASRRKLIVAAAVAAALATLVPIRQSILAPAEIVPVSPALVRAPFDGVVDAIPVTPNQAVHAGDKLATLDTRQLRTRYDVASKALDMARAEYTEASQEALTDPKAKGRLAILQSKIEQQQAEVSYVGGMLQRADILAPVDGVAVFDDVNDWIGRPVVLGERIMMVASPRDTEVEIQVPVSDVATFASGSPVLFFNNIEPDRPASARLIFASYGSSLTAEGVLSYRFRAKLDADEQPLRLGLKGTAKVYGPRQILALWLLRRPIATLRQWLTF